MTPHPFRIQVAQDILDDLQTRLARTRWPDEVKDAGWDYGTNRAYLRELVAYWQTGFDWRAQEAMLNALPQFRVKINDLNIHFIHAKGRGPNPKPLLLCHGWPDSFLRMLKLLPLLTDPGAHGGNPEDAFDVVIPSLPGYGFSESPLKKGFTNEDTADLLAKLMTDGLGYEKFAAHGGDWGSSIVEQLARRHGSKLVGIHLTDVAYGHTLGAPPTDLTSEEKDYLARLTKWQVTEGSYGHQQGTKPQTLAYGLTDSPTGWAAWLVEKFRQWSDCDGEIEKRFSKDELLTNITLYWVTQTINSASRTYYEAFHNIDPTDLATRIDDVPAGFAIFPQDIASPTPRHYADRFFNVQHWTELARGGHYTAWEEPELLAEDLRKFFRKLRKE